MVYASLTKFTGCLTGAVPKSLGEMRVLTGLRLKEGGAGLSCGDWGFAAFPAARRRLEFGVWGLEF